MLKQERQAFILQQLNIHNRVMSNDLLGKLQVSEDTIRRDLQELADEGKLIKVHGGALSKSFHFTLSANQVYLPEEKKTIAEKAATLIRDNMVVLLTGGTTIRELVKALPQNMRATFITPSVPIALELMNHPHSEVIFIGNRLNKDAQMATGVNVLRQLGTIQADLCILGTNAINLESGITESSWEIIEVKREMISAAGKLVSVAISEKLNTAQPLQVCPLKEIDYLVTELSPEHPMLQAYKAEGVTLL
ncbi:MAG TPA: DeoR/GlpR family DNA-binding transcription regulator [Phnomibacter sp.]|nr:DeoR/GlpR family DNA-binding transcription regulator [Phnomibacter sp.]